MALLPPEQVGWRRRPRQQVTEKRTAPASPARPDRGVLYVNSGRVNQVLLEHSVTSLRTFYAGHVKVLTDQPLRLPQYLDCQVIQVAIPDEFNKTRFASRYLKTKIAEYAFPNTLYLDSDTTVLNDPEPVWNLLDHAPNHVLMTQDVIPFQDWTGPSKEERQFINRLGITRNTHFNSGVIAFTPTEKVLDLLRTWHEEWKRFKRQDQPALLRAVAQTGLTPDTLPNQFNWMNPDRNPTPPPDTVVHHNCGTWKTHITVSPNAGNPTRPINGEWNS